MSHLGESFDRRRQRMKAFGAASSTVYDSAFLRHLCACLAPATDSDPGSSRFGNLFHRMSASNVAAVNP